MIINKTFHYLLITLLLILISPLLSFGQVTSTGNFLEMTLSPTNPKPGQIAKITLTSFSYDLNRLKITWLVNGVEKMTDIGLKEFSVPTGKNGQKSTIKALVETPTDGTKEITAFFIPSIVDLIYESLSYTPPFYKGKALNPNQGTVIVHAIPELIQSNGVKISNQNIVYLWKKNGESQPSVSGLGKNSFVFTGTIPVRDILIEVTASSVDNTIQAYERINVLSIDPKIIFYENNPIYGIMFNKAITGPINLITSEFSTLAEPYFFSTNQGENKTLSYTWSMNGKTVPNQKPNNSFTARIENQSVGIAEINLKMTDSMKLFQLGNSSYTINFNKQQ